MSGAGGGGSSPPVLGELTAALSRLHGHGADGGGSGTGAPPALLRTGGVAAPVASPARARATPPAPGAALHLPAGDRGVRDAIASLFEFSKTTLKALDDSKAAETAMQKQLNDFRAAHQRECAEHKHELSACRDALQDAMASLERIQHDARRDRTEVDDLRAAVEELRLQRSATGGGHVELSPQRSVSFADERSESPADLARVSAGLQRVVRRIDATDAHAADLTARVDVLHHRVAAHRPAGEGAVDGTRTGAPSSDADIAVLAAEIRAVSQRVEQQGAVVDRLSAGGGGAGARATTPSASALTAPAPTALASPTPAAGAGVVVTESDRRRWDLQARDAMELRADVDRQQTAITALQRRVASAPPSPPRGRAGAPQHQYSRNVSPAPDVPTELAVVAKDIAAVRAGVDEAQRQVSLAHANVHDLRQQACTRADLARVEAEMAALQRRCEGGPGAPAVPSTTSRDLDDPRHGGDASDDDARYRRGRDAPASGRQSGTPSAAIVDRLAHDVTELKKHAESGVGRQQHHTNQRIDAELCGIRRQLDQHQQQLVAMGGGRGQPPASASAPPGKGKESPRWRSPTRPEGAASPRETVPQQPSARRGRSMSPPPEGWGRGGDAPSQPQSRHSRHALTTEARLADIERTLRDVVVRDVYEPWARDTQDRVDELFDEFEVMKDVLCKEVVARMAGERGGNAASLPPLPPGAGAAGVGVGTPKHQYAPQPPPSAGQYPPAPGSPSRGGGRSGRELSLESIADTRDVHPMWRMHAAPAPQALSRWETMKLVEHAAARNEAAIAQLREDMDHVGRQVSHSRAVSPSPSPRPAPLAPADDARLSACERRVDDLAASTSEQISDIRLMLSKEHLTALCTTLVDEILSTRQLRAPLPSQPPAPRKSISPSPARALPPLTPLPEDAPPPSGDVAALAHRVARLEALNFPTVGEPHASQTMALLEATRTQHAEAQALWQEFAMEKQRVTLLQQRVDAVAGGGGAVGALSTDVQLRQVREEVALLRATVAGGDAERAASHALAAEVSRMKDVQDTLTIASAEQRRGIERMREALQEIAKIHNLQAAQQQGWGDGTTAAAAAAAAALRGASHMDATRGDTAPVPVPTAPYSPTRLLSASAASHESAVTMKTLSDMRAELNELRDTKAQVHKACAAQQAMVEQLHELVRGAPGLGVAEEVRALRGRVAVIEDAIPQAAQVATLRVDVAAVGREQDEMRGTLRRVTEVASDVLTIKTTLAGHGTDIAAVQGRLQQLLMASDGLNIAAHVGGRPIQATSPTTRDVAQLVDGDLPQQIAKLDERVRLIGTKLDNFSVMCTSNIGRLEGRAAFGDETTSSLEERVTDLARMFTALELRVRAVVQGHHSTQPTPTPILTPNGAATPPAAGREWGATALSKTTGAGGGMVSPLDDRLAVQQGRYAQQPQPGFTGTLVSPPSDDGTAGGAGGTGAISPTGYPHVGATGAMMGSGSGMGMGGMDFTASGLAAIWRALAQQEQRLNERITAAVRAVAMAGTSAGGHAPLSSPTRHVSPRDGGGGGGGDDRALRQLHVHVERLREDLAHQALRTATAHEDTARCTHEIKALRTELDTLSHLRARPGQHPTPGTGDGSHGMWAPGGHRPQRRSVSPPAPVLQDVSNTVGGRGAGAGVLTTKRDGSASDVAASLTVLASRVDALDAARAEHAQSAMAITQYFDRLDNLYALFSVDKRVAAKLADEPVHVKVKHLLALPLLEHVTEHVASVEQLLLSKIQTLTSALKPTPTLRLTPAAAVEGNY